MARTSTIDVYLEVGAKRVFAGALDWPGWCRSGKNDDEALVALADYGPRYAAALRRKRVAFTPPGDASALKVIQRLEGNATTDFGAPGSPPSDDKQPLTGTDLDRRRAVLEACWKALDAAAKAASTKVLRKGPRGGGRDLDKIIEHVMGADAGYLSGLGVKFKIADDADPTKEMKRLRRTILDTLASVADGRPIPPGPRGGARWTPRYFIRRAAWHALDHAWEIEDRAESP